jgi:nucleoside-diphosphate-sugar epimerase
MRILIIGGTGVLSRLIAIEAISNGHQVTILTDGKGTLSEPVGLERHIQVDRDNAIALKQALAATGVESWDLVVDAICYRPEQAESLLSAIDGKSKHSIVISTAILYDPAIDRPLRTNDKLATDLELGKYGREKVAMEKVWLQAWDRDNHPVTILRPPHILGAGAELGIVPLHNRDQYVINRLKNHQPLLLADGGKQMMQVVDSKDIAKVVLAAVGNQKTFGKIYNCANPEVITGYQYFKTIAELLNVELQLKEIPSTEICSSGWGWVITTFSRILDMRSLQQDIGYVPSTPLKQSLRETLDNLLSSGNNYEYPDFSLHEIEAELESGVGNSHEVLTKYAANKDRTPIDLRMNTDPPVYPNIAGTVTVQQFSILNF